MTGVLDYVDAAGEAPGASGRKGGAAEEGWNDSPG